MAGIGRWQEERGGRYREMAEERSGRLVQLQVQLVGSWPQNRWLVGGRLSNIVVGCPLQTGGSLRPVPHLISASTMFLLTVSEHLFVCRCTDIHILVIAAAY